MKYNLVVNGDHKNLVVYIPNDPEPLRAADNNHPNFDAIYAKVLADDYADLANLFDPSFALAQRFERLSDRLALAGGRVYFDGDEVHNVLTDQIVRLQQEGVEDWKPLVPFYENLAQNPGEHSREHLFRWLQATGGFTITDDGLIVGYKGVHWNQAEGIYESGWAGKAIVDGVWVEGRIPNQPDTVVEMPRSSVTFDPYNGCSSGLHIGTYEYARKYGTQVIEVHLNPRDVVSVPVEAHDKKMRVCRYLAKGPVDGPYTSSIIRPERATATA